MLPFIAIPSYKRANTISKKTLKFLQTSNYPVDKIHIFVANEEEFQDYKRLVSEDLYGEIIVGVKGLMEQRNFITSFYKEDEIIIQMDDDVISIKSNLDFLTLVEIGVNSLYGRTSGIWGVLPNDDGRRFKDATTKHLAHILGSFFIVRNHRTIKITHTEKEDMERSILYFRRYGEVLRYQNAGVATTYRKGTGGLQITDRVDTMKAGIQNLITQYPDYCRLVQKKGITDIILNWRVEPYKTPHTNDDPSHPALPKT